MAYNESNPKWAMRAILAASNSLRKTLLQVREEHPDLPEMSIHVTETTEGASVSSSPSSSWLIITIEADTPEHAEEHAKELENQGCICASSGPTSVTCYCLGV